MIPTKHFLPRDPQNQWRAGSKMRTKRSQSITRRAQPAVPKGSCTQLVEVTSDIGVWHPDGYIELRDRKKDIIISGGENISTIEVEQAVAKHSAVLECAVVAIPDEKWGERPKAFVTLRPGQSTTEQEIIVFCRERLAHFKCPAAIEFGDLPKTSTGKIQKFVLREKEWAGYEKRIH